MIYPAIQDVYEYPDSNISVKYDSAGLFKCGTAASVWDSSLVIAKYLERSCPTSKRIKSLGKKAKILELGSGTGLLAKVLAQRVFPEATVVATDLAAALPLLDLNLRLDKDTGDESNINIRKLEWGNDEDINKILEEFGRFDLIILSDLITWPSLYEALAVSFGRLLSKDTVAVLAHECRTFEKEARFFAILQEKKIRFKTIEAKDQDPQYQSEDIYMFSMSR